MVLNQKELTSNVEPTYIPKTISYFLGEVSSICNVSEKLLKIDDFVKRLEEELRKIDAFKRELPITLHLISDAIVALKEEVIRCTKENVEPVLEEFIPLKRACDEADKNDAEKESHKESRDKKNWMSSVQLWNHSDNQNSEFNQNLKQSAAMESNKEFAIENVGMVEHIYAPCEGSKEGRLFEGHSAFPVVETKAEDMEESPVARLSLFTPGTSSPSEGLMSSVLSSKTSGSRAVTSHSPNVQSILRTTFRPLQQQSRRKRRRCWSPDLHRRFVSALQHLGGSQVATPKQIREHMQVDGLTNDEVKSHLQKYRLHTRKLPAAVTLNSTSPGTLSLEAAIWPRNEFDEFSEQNQSQSGLTNDEGNSHLQNDRLYTPKLPAGVTLSSASPGTLSLEAAIWPKNQCDESSEQNQLQSGLTNDEVKSHLQKYMPHGHKLPAAVTLNSESPGTLSLEAAIWPRNQFDESSKQNQSQSGSPQGPFQLTETTGGTSATRIDSMDDDEDDKSESFGCKFRIHTSV